MPESEEIIDRPDHRAKKNPEQIPPIEPKSHMLVRETISQDHSI
jgi:hypothetical protein